MTVARLRVSTDAERNSDRTHSLTLLRIADALRPLSDPDEIMFTVCSILGERLGVSRVFYATIVDETVAVITRDYVDGVRSIAGRIPLDVTGPVLTEIFRRGEDLSITDTSADPRFPESARETLAEMQIASAMAIGLVKGGRWVGTLGVHNATPRAWTADEVALLRETAERTWAALERAQAQAAHRESEERYAASKERLLDLDAMERLHRVSTRFFDEEGLQGVLEEIVEAAIAVTQADFGNIQVLDPRSGELAIVAARGFPDWWIEYWNRVTKGQGSCGTALELTERVVVEDVLQSSIFNTSAALDVQLRAGVRACQSTPLFDRSGVPLGMISTHYATPQRPSDRGLRLLDLLARQAADILDRARREAEERRRDTEQKLLADVGGVLSASDYEHALASVTRLAVDSLADFAVIYLVEEEGGIRRAAAASRAPEHAQLFDTILAQPSRPRPTHPIWEVVAHGRSLIREYDPATYETIAEGPVHLEALRNTNPRSALIAPMVTGDSCIGAIALTSVSRQFDERDTAVVEEIGRRCALLVENARLHERERRAIRARSDVLGIVAHDLRNPLTSIVLNTRILQHDSTDTESVDSIRRAATRMTRIIQDLLEVARFEAGSLEVERAQVLAADLVAEAVQAHRKSIAERGLEIRIAAAAELPRVWADKERVAQVFENLISNAVRFTASGAITIGASVSGGEIRFSVADTGNGIPAENLPRIFDPFWQTRHRTHDGAGLGLSIVKTIVEAHRGRAWATSEVGIGSTFYFTLPIATDPVATPSLPDAAVNEPSDPVVLVVDDDADFRRALARILRQRGYAAVTAANGEEGLDYLSRGERPAVIVLDLAMPVLDGWAFLEARNNTPALRSIPVIVVSAQAESANHLATMDVTLLSKPLSPEDLIAAMPRPTPSAR
jgi:signal transduction histidine kinase/CheY-like chemotaxis protein